MMATFPDKLKLVPAPTERRLNQRQLLECETHRETYLTWLYHLGKDPQNADGYSRSTVTRDAYRIDQFYRWVWDQHGGYTTAITHEHANDYVDHLAYGDGSNSHKDRCVKAPKRYFEWQHHEHGGQLWDSPRTFSTATTGNVKGSMRFCCIGSVRRAGSCGS